MRKPVARRQGVHRLGVARLRALWLLVAVLLSGSVAPPVAAEHVSRVEPDRARDSQWQQYGDEGGHWTGGDGTTSVPLPDGRIAWLFSDTFLGVVKPSHCRPPNTPFLRNSIVVQSGQTLTTVTGGTEREPRSLVEPGPATLGPSSSWYWVADGTVENDVLRVFYNRYEAAGTGPLDVRPAGTVIATFSLPDLALLGTVSVPGTGRVLWGSALVEEADHTYIYGSEIGEPTKFAHLARARAGNLSGPWEYRTADGWSTAEPRSARLLSGVGTGFSVDRVGGRYTLITQETNVAFSGHIVAYFAARPEGPFTKPTYLYQAPEAADERIIYDARLHPLSTARRLVVSYNVNTLRLGENERDARIYRPRFLTVTLRGVPPLAPAVPPPPTRLTVEVADGIAKLRWRSAGPKVSHWVYRRDVTAGQTGFGRVVAVGSGTAAVVGMLAPGHEYEFALTAVNDAGESTASAPQRALVRVNPPSEPSAPRAESLPDGQIRVSWTGSATGSPWYVVGKRDLMAGGDFVNLPQTVAAGTSLTVDSLEGGHLYEFRVSAVNTAGTTTGWETVKATSRREPGRSAAA